MGELLPIHRLYRDHVRETGSYCFLETRTLVGAEVSNVDQEIDATMLPEPRRRQGQDMAAVWQKR